MIWTAPPDKDTGNTALKSKTNGHDRTRDLLLPRPLSGQMELKAEEARA